MAVTGTITITTLLFFYLVHRHWRQPLWIAVPAAGALLAVDLLFVAANLTKITHGAWVPLLIALVVFTLLTTWQRGRELVTARRDEKEGPLRAFVEQLHERRPPVIRVPGTAVFLNRGKATTPLAMRANVEHNHILHEHVLILSIETRPRPYIPAEHRIAIDDLGHRDDGIFFATARFGYMEAPDVPGLLPLVRAAGIETALDEDDLTYFLSKIELHRSDAPGMSRWRKQLFLATTHLTADATEYFHLPRTQTVIMGSRIEV
jgi:KUP system potassium uptake protein